MFILIPKNGFGQRGRGSHGGWGSFIEDRSFQNNFGDEGDRIPNDGFDVGDRTADRSGQRFHGESQPRFRAGEYEPRFGDGGSGQRFGSCQSPQRFRSQDDPEVQIIDMKGPAGKRKMKREQGGRKAGKGNLCHYFSTYFVLIFSSCFFRSWRT